MQCLHTATSRACLRVGRPARLNLLVAAGRNQAPARPAREWSMQAVIGPSCASQPPDWTQWLVRTAGGSPKILGEGSGLGAPAPLATQAAARVGPQAAGKRHSQLFSSKTLSTPGVFPEEPTTKRVNSVSGWVLLQEAPGGGRGGRGKGPRRPCWDVRPPPARYFLRMRGSSLTGSGVFRRLGAAAGGQKRDPRLIRRCRGKKCVYTQHTGGGTV